MTRDEFEAKIVAKAGQDEAFRKALLADPKGTLQKELQELKTGITLPESLQVNVVEESPNQLYLRLPVAKTGNLSEAELAGVAGGAGQQPPPVTAAIAIDVTAVTTAVTTGPAVVVSGPTNVVVIGTTAIIV